MPYLELRKARRSKTRMIRADGTFTVGRSRDNRVVLSDRSISRRHCEFSVVDDGAVQVRDLGSGLGVAVNGAKVSHATLMPGDRVRIGPYTLTLRLHVESDGRRKRFGRGSRERSRETVAASTTPSGYQNGHSTRDSARAGHRESLKPVETRPGAPATPNGALNGRPTSDARNGHTTANEPDAKRNEQSAAPLAATPSRASDTARSDTSDGDAPREPIDQSVASQDGVENSIGTGPADDTAESNVATSEEGAAESPNEVQARGTSEAPSRPDPIHNELRQLREELAALRTSLQRDARQEAEDTSSTEREGVGMAPPFESGEPVRVVSLATDAANQSSDVEAPVEATPRKGAASVDDQPTDTVDGSAAPAPAEMPVPTGARPRTEDDAAHEPDLAPERIFLANRRLWQRNPEDRDPWAWLVIVISILLAVGILGGTACMLFR